MATAYFDVQEARGRLAGNLDAVAKAEDLEKQIRGLAGVGGPPGGFAPQFEVDRVLALLYDLQQEAAASRGAWQANSARLNRVLRLNPGAVVVPLEPPHLQVTLIPPGRAVDDLIPVGLLNRPELASQKALVRATLERLRQERLRPCFPAWCSRAVMGPAMFLWAANSKAVPTAPRCKAMAASTLTWESSGPSKPGLGNRAVVRERAAQQQQAVLELFNTEDRVAEEVVQAHALLEAAAVQIGKAEAGVREANTTFAGTRIGLRETRDAGGRSNRSTGRKKR